MNEKTIKLEYHHDVKGIFGRSETLETKYFYLDGFDPATLAAEPERFKNCLDKALRHILTDAAGTFTWIDIFNSNEKVIYRITTELDIDRHDFKRHLVLSEYDINCISRKDATRKEIIALASRLFNEEFIKANRKEHTA